VSKPFLTGTECTEIECGELSVMCVLENKRGEMEVLDCVSQAGAGIRHGKFKLLWLWVFCLSRQEQIALFKQEMASSCEHALRIDKGIVSPLVRKQEQ
jgi:hypothetical protein